MNWTIRNKMLGMGIFLVAILAVLAAFNYNTNNNVLRKLTDNNKRTEQLLLLKDMN